MVRLRKTGRPEQDVVGWVGGRHGGSLATSRFGHLVRPVRLPRTPADPGEAPKGRSLGLMFFRWISSLHEGWLVAPAKHSAITL